MLRQTTWPLYPPDTPSTGRRQGLLVQGRKGWKGREAERVRGRLGLTICSRLLILSLDRWGVSLCLYHSFVCLSLPPCLYHMAHKELFVCLYHHVSTTMWPLCLSLPPCLCLPLCVCPCRLFVCLPLSSVFVRLAVSPVSCCLFIVSRGSLVSLVSLACVCTAATAARHSDGTDRHMKGCYRHCCAPLGLLPLPFGI